MMILIHRRWIALKGAGQPSSVAARTVRKMCIRDSFRVAFLLSQGGEFGFVVFGAAKALGVIDDQVFVMAVAVISLTMLLTPLLAKLGNRLAIWAAEKATETHEDSRYQAQSDETETQVVIAGYGRVGHTVGTILASSDIPYVAFDTDAALVARWRSEGHPVFYGDVADPELLGNASLHRVALVILTIDDGPTAIRAATLIRSHVPQMTIVARARDLVTCDALHQVGVSHAFPETLEASLRLAAQSLEALGISTDQTDMLPVSYTHLDVYKRQISTDAPPASR